MSTTAKVTSVTGHHLAALVEQFEEVVDELPHLLAAVEAVP